MGNLPIAKDKIMYGLVNKAIKDLVVSNFGEDAWEQIRVSAQVQTDEFSPLQTYDDAVTYNLVGAASKLLGTPPEEILRSFGRHWILFTAKEGYGDLMTLFGKDFLSCIRNLNQMHSRMGAMMPHLKPPRFVVTEETKGKICIEYHSERKGLAPMVTGLLEGLAEKHKVKANIRHLPRKEGAAHENFEVNIDA